MTKTRSQSSTKHERILRQGKKQSPRGIQPYLNKHFTKHTSLAKIPKSAGDSLHFYIFSQKNSEFGVFGVTNDPYRRIGEYLKREINTINFTKRLKTQLWYGPRQAIFLLETRLLAKIKQYHKYNHLLVTNTQNNQLEFFPSEYREDIEGLVKVLIPFHPTESLGFHRCVR